MDRSLEIIERENLISNPFAIKCLSGEVSKCSSRTARSRFWSLPARTDIHELRSRKGGSGRVGEKCFALLLLLLMVDSTLHAQGTGCQIIPRSWTKATSRCTLLPVLVKLKNLSYPTLLRRCAIPWRTFYQSKENYSLSLCLSNSVFFLRLIPSLSIFLSPLYFCWCLSAPYILSHTQVLTKQHVYKVSHCIYAGILGFCN